MAAVLLGAAMLLPGMADAAPASAGSTILNRAFIEYVPAGFTQVERVDSNAVQAIVQAVEAVSLTRSQTVSRPPGTVATLSHILTNIGNRTSAYTLQLTPGGTDCPATTFNLSSLRLVRDINGNGVADASDPVPALGMPGALSLEPGESASLIVEGGTPAQNSGSACVVLTATSNVQNASAHNVDVVNLSNAAVVTLFKAATYPAIIEPGKSTVSFRITANNIGAQDAAGVPTVPEGATVVVDGVSRTLLLVRDLIPAGMQYVAGTLQSQNAGALRLYRLPSDPPFSYRTGADDASVAEVGIGMPVALARNATLGMSFSAKVMPGAAGAVANEAQGYYNDGAAPAVATSNTVVIPVTAARLGLAKQAGSPAAQFKASGELDGTSIVRFSLRLRNYGGVTLYGAQINDLLESGSGGFGTYTAQPVPAAGEYTVVAGSLAIASSNGATASVNPAFTGRSGANALLAPAAVLPAGSEFTVQFDLRINLSGRTGNLLNSATAAAALTSSGPLQITDMSANGADPDANRNGDPGDDSEPTPVPTQAAALVLQKIASIPRRISSGVYELDYTLRITNAGGTAAPHVRLLDNLNCTFDMDRADTHIASWELIAPPTARNGQLLPAASFTGRVPCDRAGNNSAGSAGVPSEAVLSLTDGSRSLEPGKTEEVTFTVRANVKPEYAAAGTRIRNKAWAASYQNNTIATGPLIQSAAGTTESLLIDPQGVVYNAITRLPVAGAVVTVARASCSSSAAGPITAAQIYLGDSGLYTYNTDGSVSMTVGATGEYQFFFRSPPVNDFCEYTMSVKPPAGSSYVSPSALLPAQAGTYATCGPVVPNAAPPQGSEDPRYYFRFRAGVDPANPANVCEVVHNHIPLDPGSLSGMLLKKEGSKKEAEFGDFIDYALTLTNQTAMALPGISFSDVLPAGFAYVAGTTRIDGSQASDPAGGAGPRLTFSPSTTLAPGATLSVRYRLRIGVGAAIGSDAVNRARASAGTIQSNEASWRVRVNGGVFADDAFAFGKVYIGCPRSDGGLDPDQRKGIPGVRLYMENGNSVITDADGKWSIYGLKPVTHAIRVDATTLPAGARLAIVDNRNAGSPDSRFLDLKKGEFVRADFMVDNCGENALLQEIEKRRVASAAIEGQADTEATKVRIAADGKAATTGDLRGLAAAGQIAASGAAPVVQPSNRALIDLPASVTAPLQSSQGASPFQPAYPLSPLASPAGGAGMLGPLPAPGVIDLETVLPQENSQAGFIGLKNGDTMLSQTINVRVKGPLGAKLVLSVNGDAIDPRRIGKKVSLPATGITAWEYIGVTLRPGENQLRLQASDDFGNQRADERLSVIAPDKLSSVEIDLPENARADIRTPIAIKIRLVDAKGVTVTARTQLTLDTDRGRWLDTDLNTSEPGTQVFIEGGSASFTYIPPGEPGDARLRVNAGGLVKEARLVLLPEQRAMAGIGIVEGVLDFSRGGAITLGTPSSSNAFEAELTGLARESGDTRLAARSAFYFKGTVRGDYLLTTAFDSDKTTRDRLFRDIRPDELYPVYGDTSVKGFDAQSTQKLYVRIDKNRSFLLYGDFTTASSAEVRQLSQISRSLTGFKHQYEEANARVASFAAYDNLKQKVEEIPALGISGPYFVSAVSSDDLLANSEKVEILVRDRSQPNIVLKATALSRFTDYNIEPMNGRLLFLRPIATLDENFNPQSIRITYEVSDGGPKFLIAGTDAQLKITDKLQVGAIAATDENPENRRKLLAATAVARLGEKTVVNAEVVATQTDLKGEGSAGRIELLHDSAGLKLQGQLLHTGENFDNPGASVTGGRSEGTARLEYTIDETTRMRGEALYSKDIASTDTRVGISVALQKKLGDLLVGEIGLRHGNQSGSSAGSFDYGKVGVATAAGGGSGGSSIGSVSGGTSESVSTTTVLGRVTSRIPALPQAQVFAEAEQDVEHSDRHAVAIGGTYALTEQTRAYGRYEFASSLTSLYNLNATQQRNVALFGLESAYMEGGRVYNEYRVANVIDGRSTQNAFGVRNTFKVAEGLNVTAGFEQTREVGGNSGSVIAADGSPATAPSSDATAIVTGADYTHGALKMSVTLELRQASSADTILNTLGLSYRLDEDWSLLSRSVYNASRSTGAGAAGSELVQTRQQLGLAYRPGGGLDNWNALARYEHKYERIGAGGAITADGGSVLGSNLPGINRTHIVAGLVNYNPVRGSYITSRYAAKYTLFSDDIGKSSYWAQLGHMRYTRDLNREWDIGVQGGVLYGKGGAVQSTLGLEVGYQAMRNMWISAGYNVLGLRDPDLSGADHTSKGAYIRLRFKFDEDTLGMGAAPSPSSSSSSSASSPLARLTSLLNGRDAAVPPPSAPPQLTGWKPGRPFGARVVFRESELFAQGQTALTPAGGQLIQQLTAQLGSEQVGQLSISAGHTPGVAGQADLWLARAAAVRNAIKAAGPREISIATDSQDLDPLTGADAANAAAGPRRLQIALVTG